MTLLGDRPEPTASQREATRHPPEGSRPVMFQNWERLHFLHWKIDPAVIQSTLPAGLTVDTHEGSAWLGLVPFFMRKVRPAWLPAVPWLSNFQELNVRTYVYSEDGTPGVWFYSLDCNQPIAVWAARSFFHLPYHHARMSWQETSDGQIRYQSQRKTDPNEIVAEFHYPNGEGQIRDEGTAAPLATDFQEAAAGSLEFFLLERYLLFSQRHDGSLRSGQVAHRPYRYQNSVPTQWNCRPLELEGFPLESEKMPDHCCQTEDVSVRIFGLKKLAKQKIKR